MKEHKKMDQKQVSNVTLYFVRGHLSRKQTVAPSFKSIYFDAAEQLTTLPSLQIPFFNFFNLFKASRVAQFVKTVGNAFEQKNTVPAEYFEFRPFSIT